MKNLNDVLAEVKASWAQAGSGDNVKDALRQHRERKFRLLVAYSIVMFLCLVAAGLFLAFNGPAAAKTFGSLAGLAGGGGGFVLLMGAWKDWSRTDLLLILLDEATRAQTEAIIDALIGKL